MCKNKTEQYAVKFTYLPNNAEYFVSMVEFINLGSRNQHKKAEKLVLNKYQKLGSRVTILSVTYQ